MPTLRHSDGRKLPKPDVFGLQLHCDGVSRSPLVIAAKARSFPLLNHRALEKLHAPPPLPARRTLTLFVDLNSKAQERKGTDTLALKSTEMTNFGQSMLSRIEALAAKIGNNDEDTSEGTISRSVVVSPIRRVKQADRTLVLKGVERECESQSNTVCTSTAHKRVYASTHALLYLCPLDTFRARFH